VHRAGCRVLDRAELQLEQSSCKTRSSLNGEHIHASRWKIKHERREQGSKDSVVFWCFYVLKFCTFPRFRSRLGRLRKFANWMVDCNFCEKKKSCFHLVGLLHCVRAIFGKVFRFGLGVSTDHITHCTLRHIDLWSSANMQSWLIPGLVKHRRSSHVNTVRFESIREKIQSWTKVFRLSFFEVHRSAQLRAKGCALRCVT
jgi:hypothetical protein